MDPARRPQARSRNEGEEPLEDSTKGGEGFGGGLGDGFDPFGFESRDGEDAADGGDGAAAGAASGGARRAGATAAAPAFWGARAPGGGGGARGGVAVAEGGAGGAAGGGMRSSVFPGTGGMPPMWPGFPPPWAGVQAAGSSSGAGGWSDWLAAVAAIGPNLLHGDVPTMSTGAPRTMGIHSDATREEEAPTPPPATNRRKFYNGDAGYPNRPGYLTPYKGQRYHIPDWRRGAAPSGEQEAFNFLHSSIRNSVERAFGVWENKWRILFNMPSYPMEKQMMIIAATMCLHNFIRENDALDKHFVKCDRNPDYVPTIPSRYARYVPRNASDTSTRHSSDRSMDKFRDDLARAIYLSRS
ncbi:hypothetical protein EJB05_29863, partial [Eragrostis curvula]